MRTLQRHRDRSMSEHSRRIYNTTKWKEVRKRVLAEEPVCHWCKRAPSTQADHIVELDRGGDPYERTNLVGSCQKCNSARGAAYQAKVAARRRQERGYGYSVTMPKPCEYCGELFTPDRRNEERGGGRFCSTECAGKNNRVARWTWTLEWDCTACGKHMTAGPYEDTKPPTIRPRHTCGDKECQQKHNLWSANEANWKKTGQLRQHELRKPTNWTVNVIEPDVFSGRLERGTPPPLSKIFDRTNQNADEMTAMTADSPIVGRVEPRLITPVLGHESFGPAVAEWARRNLEHELMDWQKIALDGQLQHDGTGQLIHSESLISVARQNGKSWAMKAALGWWLTEMPEIAGRPQTVISAAHKLDRAVGMFQELAPILEARFGAVPRWSYGRNTLELPNGSKWYVLAATPQNAHGFTADALFLDEIWSIGPEVIFDAYRPTMTARPNPLMSMWSTAGDESSKVMMQLREQAIHAIDSERPSSLFFAEWSPEPGANLNNPATWAWANPALGTTITVDRLRRMAETPNRQSFLRAHCNVWISASAAWLPNGHWQQLEVDDPMPEGGVLAIDTDVTDLRYVGIRVAPRSDGRLQVLSEFVVDSAEAMWDEARRVLDDKAVRVAITPGLADLCPLDMSRRMVTWGQQEMGKYTAVVRHMILEGRLVHSGQRALAEQVNRAVAGRTAATITLSSQKSPGPIEQVRAMVAAAGLAAAPTSSIRKPMIGSGR